MTNDNICLKGLGLWGKINQRAHTCKWSPHSERATHCSHHREVFPEKKEIRRNEETGVKKRMENLDKGNFHRICPSNEQHSVWLPAQTALIHIWPWAPLGTINESDTLTRVAVIDFDTLWTDTTVSKKSGRQEKDWLQCHSPRQSGSHATWLHE